MLLHRLLELSKTLIPHYLPFCKGEDDSLSQCSKIVGTLGFFRTACPINTFLEIVIDIFFAPNACLFRLYIPSLSYVISGCKALCYGFATRALIDSTSISVHSCITPLSHFVCLGQWTDKLADG